MDFVYAAITWHLMVDLSATIICFYRIMHLLQFCNTCDKKEIK